MPKPMKTMKPCRDRERRREPGLARRSSELGSILPPFFVQSSVLVITTP
jgi:hypothetical protein